MKNSIISILKGVLSWIHLLLIISIFLTSIYFVLYYLFNLSNFLFSLVTCNHILIYYLSSFVIMLVLFLASGEGINTALDKLSMRLRNKKKGFFSQDKRTIAFVIKSLLIIPKRTLIFFFYLLILILNQLQSLAPELNIYSYIPNDLQEFLQANTYAIIIFIAIDRISKTFAKEKDQSKGHIISFLSWFIK